MLDRPQLMLWFANLLYGIAALMLLYATIFFVVHLPIFPVRQVKVDGQLEHVTREQVEYIIKHELRGTFFTLDIDRVRQSFEKLPWVRDVVVRRRWPDRVDIQLEEHIALARWGDSGLISTTGERFDAASDAALPVLYGPDGSEKEVVKGYNDFKQILTPTQLLPKVVVLSARRAWHVRLNNGLQVELGRDQEAARLTKLVSVYNSTLAKLPFTVAYVDTRYPNGFAVRIPEGQSLRAPVAKQPPPPAKPAVVKPPARA
jgi:cell division protein FtsQ